MDTSVDVHDVRRRAAEILASFLGELKALGPLPIEIGAVDMPAPLGSGHVRITLKGPAEIVRPVREVLYDTLSWAA